MGQHEAELLHDLSSPDVLATSPQRPGNYAAIVRRPPEGREGRGGTSSAATLTGGSLASMWRI